MDASLHMYLVSYHHSVPCCAGYARRHGRKYCRLPLNKSLLFGTTRKFEWQVVAIVGCALSTISSCPWRLLPRRRAKKLFVRSVGRLGGILNAPRGWFSCFRDQCMQCSGLHRRTLSAGKHFNTTIVIVCTESRPPPPDAAHPYRKVSLHDRRLQKMPSRRTPKHRKALLRGSSRPL